MIWLLVGRVPSNGESYCAAVASIYSIGLNAVRNWQTFLYGKTEIVEVLSILAHIVERVLDWVKSWLAGSAENRRIISVKNRKFSVNKENSNGAVLREILALAFLDLI